MEVEQLLSWVRYERSRLTGFTALDEILTIVTEATERVAAAERQVKDYETKCQGLQAAQSQADADYDAKVASLQVQLEQRKQEADANFDKALTERKESLAKLDSDVAAKLQFYNALVVDVQTAEAQMVDVSHTKLELESDVASLRKQLQDIKDSIH